MRELHLFAACGGGILGSLLLGHTCVCAVEIDEYRRFRLLQRQQEGLLPKFVLHDNVCTFDGKPWRGLVDGVCGGFPCQNISVAGKQEGLAGEESKLWYEMYRICREVQPKYIFIENSPNLRNKGLNEVLKGLAEFGYDAKWCVLGADDVGAPHKRKRMWILAYSRYWLRRDDFRERLENNSRRKIPSIWEYSPIKASRPSPVSEVVADSGSERCKKRRRTRTAKKKFDVIECCGEMADADGVRLEESPGNRQEERCRTSDMSGYCCWSHDPADEQGAVESQLGRVVDGIPDRVDRISAIGDAQVPLQCATAFTILNNEFLRDFTI